MAASAPTSAPPHDVKISANEKTIKIFDWEIRATVLPISNAAELDSLQTSLSGLPLPEMTFGNNCLLLKHTKTGWEYRFDAESALKGVRMGEARPGEPDVKVGYSKAWMDSRADIPIESQFKPVVTKPYDWTYTTTYAGHTTSGQSDFVPASATDPSQQIPISQLTRPDPILYYSEVLLFEDELHDNGCSTLNIRVRVMPTCFFLLARFTLRVDNVLFRTFDTRIYHSFTSDPPRIIRQRSGWEAKYDTVKSHLESPDLAPLTDPSWVAKVLADLPASMTQKNGTGWKGMGTEVEILDLGVSVTTKAAAS
jgi:type 2A phosphatase activator TIP41